MTPFEAARGGGVRVITERLLAAACGPSHGIDPGRFPATRSRSSYSVEELDARRGDRRARRPEDRADLPQHARFARPPLRRHPLRAAAARARRGARGALRPGPRGLRRAPGGLSPGVGPALPSLTVAVSTRGARALGLEPRAWPVARRGRLPGAGAGAGRRPAARPGARPAGGAARRDGRCASPPPGSRAAATPRSTPPAASILLIADDDVTHPPGAYAGIRRFFAENPGLDLFVGRSLDPDGRPRKRPLPRRAG